MKITYHLKINVLDIFGEHKLQIVECRRKVLDLIDSARQRQEPTHFLSIPFNSTQIRVGYDDFKVQVLATCSQVSFFLQVFFLSICLIKIISSVWEFAKKSLSVPRNCI